MFSVKWGLNCQSSSLLKSKNVGFWRGDLDVCLSVAFRIMTKKLFLRKSVLIFSHIVSPKCRIFSPIMNTNNMEDEQNCEAVATLATLVTLVRHRQSTIRS